VKNTQQRPKPSNGKIGIDFSAVVCLPLQPRHFAVVSLPCSWGHSSVLSSSIVAWVRGPASVVGEEHTTTAKTIQTAKLE